MSYNWQQPDWAQFKYDLEHIEDAFFEFIEKTGRIKGYLEGLSKELQFETMIEMMVLEAIKTSEIEGEYLNRKDVMSSIRNNLGFNKNPEQVKDKNAEGIAELMIDVRNSFSEDLTEATLFSWHRMLMKGRENMVVGGWRTHKEPMQVVSGAMGKERIHFEAPPSESVPSEMGRFIQWFNESAPGGIYEIKKPMVRSAIAHLYFESIHPFEDGNGRIGRAISEKALSQSIKRPILLSLSISIEANKNAYYDALKSAQRSNQISPWIIYFVNTVLDAQRHTEQQIEFTLKKAKFFDHFKDQLNSRQLKVIRRMLKEGPKGFEGGMTVRKYISITSTSKATATRDLQDLVGKQIFMPFGGGRSTHYDVNLTV
ncbi:Fic family protein [Confluentibacter sediminis]|uniref:Fic family protein n=1 Tax=Confluentibacter sediminis TaxID=2219045 RepID=UPI000DADC972|nr:Fic family protein [Confluentibacter sediminis]